jgi:hypothetical protein
VGPVQKWKIGDSATLRGIYNGRVWYVQSVIVVGDTDEEVVLAVLPGAECAAPWGYINGKHGAQRQWNRWDDYKRDNWQMQKYIWHTNRLLVSLQARKYYSTIYFWRDDTGEFLCYYINFQLPFKRSHAGFDTLDLELDIIVNPDLSFEWKDLYEYQKGIDGGVLLKVWTGKIEEAKVEIFEKIEKRCYPFDGKWLAWTPSQDWPSPTLPTNWDKI